MKAFEPIQEELFENLSTSSMGSKFKNNFKIGIFWAFLAYFLFAVNLLNCKSINKWYPQLNPLGFMMYRSFTIYFISQIFLTRSEEPLLSAFNLKLRKLFFTRVSMNFLGFYSLILLLNYFRIVTVSLITSTQAVFVNIISHFILNSKLHFRYFAGFIVCFIGTYLVVSKDKLAESETKNSNKLVGFLLAIFHVLCVAYMLVINKIVLNENISNNLIFAWVGITNGLCGLVGVLLTGNYNNLFNISYVFWSLINGSIFYSAHLCLNLSFANLSPNSTTAVSYTQPVYSAILGFAMFGEHLYWTDGLGFVLILTYNLYHVMVPIKD